MWRDFSFPGAELESHKMSLGSEMGEKAPPPLSDAQSCVSRGFGLGSSWCLGKYEPQIAKSGVNQRRLSAELFERCVVRGGELEVGPRSMEVQLQT